MISLHLISRLIVFYSRQNPDSKFKIQPKRTFTISKSFGNIISIGDTYSISKIKNVLAKIMS